MCRLSSQVKYIFICVFLCNLLPICQYLTPSCVQGWCKSLRLCALYGEQNSFDLYFCTREKAQWEPWNKCQDNFYLVQFQMKAKESQPGSGNYYGISGIQMTCRGPGHDGKNTWPQHNSMQSTHLCISLCGFIKCLQVFYRTMIQSKL